MKTGEILLNRYLVCKLLYRITLIHLLLFLAPLWSDADEELEVDTRHRSRKHREVLLVKEVVDSAFEREFCPTERQYLFERDVAHKVVG